MRPHQLFELPHQKNGVEGMGGMHIVMLKGPEE